MILSSVLAFARTAAQTDSDGLTDTNGVVFANEALVDFHRRLVQRGVDASQLVEASVLGVANQGVYPYPTKPASILMMKAIEINYSDTTPANYLTADQIDVSNIPGKLSFSYLRNNQPTQRPLFDDRGDKFEVFPTPTSAHNLTALVNLFYFAKPSVFASASSTVQYPESLDAGILGWRTAANYLYSLKGVDNLVTGDKLNAKYEERVKQYIDTLGRGSQQPQTTTTITETGFEF